MKPAVKLKDRQNFNVSRMVQSKHGRAISVVTREMHKKVWLESLKETAYMKDLDTNVSLILNDS
jgi:hypothetical protein